MDQTDLQIIGLLKENSRLQWKEIGDTIHMTGQGVAARIRRMEDMGIIKKYTLKVNEEELGFKITGFVTVYMSSSDHKSFESFVNSQEGVTEAHKISGNGCYILKVVMRDSKELDQFLNLLLKYGNYALSLSVNRTK